MKKNLGKILLLCIVWVLELAAKEDIAYKLDVSTHTPYVKEAVIVTMEAWQKSTHDVILFEFKPLQKEGYELLFLGEEDLKDEGDLTHVRFKYALFPKKSGALEVPLHFVAKSASKEELKDVAIGARNVLRVVKTKDRTIPLEALHLKVQPLPEGVRLVGAYDLVANIPVKETTPFAQVDLTYTLQGHGYPPQIASLLPDIPGVERFMEVEKFDDKLFHKRIFHYALLAEKSFTIPAVSIKAFNPATKKVYMLSTPQTTIKVASVDPKEIVDKHDALPKAIDRSAYRQYLYYLLFFIAGIASAKLFPLLKKRFFPTMKGMDDISLTIAKTEDPKALLRYLIARNRTLFADEIGLLEEMLYEKRQHSFKEIKKSALQRVNDAA